MLNPKHIILIAIALIASMSMALLPPIPQDVQYHQFADQRSLFGIANFFNVMSNLPYLLFGLMGCYLVLQESRIAIIPSVKPAYVLFFAGVALVCLGSAWYHLQPSSSSLLWDRLPMALAFMSFFTVILAEYVHEKTARRLFYPLLGVGLFGVIYWYITEQLGQGDLRLYLLVQFLPVLLIPLILLLFPPRFSHGHVYGFIMGCYVLAKVLELNDQWVYDQLGFISGHSLKHLVSSLAPYGFYLALKQRKLQQPGGQSAHPGLHPL